MPESGLVIAVQFDMAKFVNIDCDTPMLLPPDMRDWVPSNHLVHFMIDAIESVDTSMAQINHRGTGSEQYPPAMLLALLVYSYCTGMFSSRQIERSSHTDVAVRFVCADTHPDHDTICTFRRNNGALLQRAFAQILEMAAQCGVLKVGQVTVAIDGTKVLANASKPAAVSYGHAEQKLNDLEMEIKELLAKAEQADSTPLQDGLTIPDEVQRREERQAALRRAKVEMEASTSLQGSIQGSSRPGEAWEGLVFPLFVRSGSGRFHARFLRNLSGKSQSLPPPPRAFGLRAW
jgi:transposase